MKAQGIFISVYQGSWEPKPWQSFVDIRCTKGLYKDSKYDEFLQIARDNDVVVGAVHYLNSGISWKDQLEFFLEKSEDADYLSVDFEGIGNTNTKQFALDAVSFTEEAKKSKKRVAFYSSPKYVQEWMYPHGVYWVRDYADLWIAQWPYSYWTDALLGVPDEAAGWEPRLPAGCTKYVKWQYGAEYLERGEYEGVGSTHVCLEVFNGTVEEMKAWAGLGEAPPVNDKICVFLDTIIELFQNFKDGRGCVE
jgi:hypothetical protein